MEPRTHPEPSSQEALQSALDEARAENVRLIAEHARQTRSADHALAAAKDCVTALVRSQEGLTRQMGLCEMENFRLATDLADALEEAQCLSQDLRDMEAAASEKSLVAEPVS